MTLTTAQEEDCQPDRIFSKIDGVISKANASFCCFLPFVAFMTW